MKVLRIHGVDTMSVDDIEDPTVGSADVLLRIDACGICGSDLGYLHQGLRRANGDPLPLGHEAAGTVIALGEAAQGFALGMRVAINPMAQLDNIVGNGGSEGAFADRLLVRTPIAGEHLHPIPDSLSAERAALTEPLAVALHSLNVARLEADERPVVLGVGPIGLGAIFWLAQRGAKDIVAVDQSPERLERARVLGAQHTIDTRDGSLREQLIACHGTSPPLFGATTVGSDVYFDMAGAASLLDQIIGFAKSRARIVMTAMYKERVNLDLKALLLRQISLLPAVGYHDEFPEVLKYLALSDQNLEAYISHKFGFLSIAEAFLAASSTSSAKVMISFDGSG